MNKSKALDNLQFSDGTNMRSLASGFLNKLSRFLKDNPGVEDVFFTVQFHDRKKVLDKLKKRGDRYVYVPVNKTFIKKLDVVEEITTKTEEIIVSKDGLENVEKTTKLQEKGVLNKCLKEEKTIQKSVIELDDSEVVSQKFETVKRLITCLPIDCKLNSLVQISQNEIIEEMCPNCSGSKKVEQKCEKCEEYEKRILSMSKENEELKTQLKIKESMLDEQKFKIKQLDDFRQSNIKKKVTIDSICESKSKEITTKDMGKSRLQQNIENIRKYNYGLRNFNTLTKEEQDKIRKDTEISLGLRVDSDEDESEGSSIYSDDSCFYD